MSLVVLDLTVFHLQVQSANPLPVTLTDRQTDRQIDRQQTDRQIDRQTDIQTETYRCKFLVFISSDPLEGPLDFKFDILGSVRSLSQGQLSNGLGGHLCQGDIGVREDGAEVIGESTEASDVKASFKSNQTH